MKKRLFSALLCLVMVLALLPVSAFAATSALTFSRHDTGTVEVTAEKLNVRAEPKSTAKILGTVTKGTILTVTDAYSKSISTWPRYHQIDYDGGTAYIMAEKTKKAEDRYVEVVEITSHYDKNAAALQGAPGASKDSPYTFAGGSGTYADPYLIATADQLNAVRKGLDKHYKLTADIDLSQWGNWVPIGGNAAYGGFGGAANVACKDVQIFHGSLDGNGHVISGMTIQISSDQIFLSEGLNIRNYGLFAGIGSTSDDYTKGINKYKGPVYTKDPYNDTTTCNIRNLGLVNYTIDVSYAALTAPLEVYAGAFAGKAGPCGIYNCYTSGGKLKFNLNYAEQSSSMSITLRARLGGFAGKADNVDVRNSYNTSPITLTSNRVDYQELLGGGVFASSVYCWIRNTFNTGSVTLPIATPDTDWTSSRAAGICPADATYEIPGVYNLAKDAATYIWNCYNTGAITAETASGILVYTASDLYIENCYNVGKITGNPVNHDNATARTSAIINAMSAVTKYGSKYIINASGNGNAVSGSAWQKSTKLGRMVLKVHPEDALSLPVVTVATPSGFTDVSGTSFCSDAVVWAVGKSITSGMTKTTFAPGATCTRAQILTFLWRAVGSPAPTIANPYNDVSDESAYYYKAALWAYEKGMVTETVFGGSTPCTRADTVTYLWQNAGSPVTEASTAFTDVSSDAPYAQAVAWAVSKGVTSGATATTFAPTATCNRGQIVTFLYRALK